MSGQIALYTVGNFTRIRDIVSGQIALWSVILPEFVRCPDVIISPAYTVLKFILIMIFFAEMMFQVVDSHLMVLCHTNLPIKHLLSVLLII